jgi:16S rRNA (uracil1498-N3)-methyltransferase
VARRRFFVESFDNGIAVLRGDDARHLARVLRAERGQQYELSDNRSACLAEITQVSPEEVHFRLLETIALAPPPFDVTVVASLIKFDRFEWLIEKATELGVAAVLPVSAARSESGLLEASRKRVERWRRIARESSQQSRRVTAPEILEPERLDRISIQAFPLRLFLDEEPGAPSLMQALRAMPSKPAALALLIGPEGGWAPAERQHLAGIWTPVSMGRQILRAETAAIAALAIVLNFWI